MNGHIIPGTPVAVDFWKKRDCPSAKFFFLTHLHSDHTLGLSSSWQYNIYCSEITSKLLIHNYGIKAGLVHPLETGRSHIIYLDEEKQEQMVVGVIDANHCPGSVMFLFEGYFGKVLYTGDFRYCDAMFKETPLENCTDIDVLFLDNTYCAPECVFPTREEAEDQIISLLEQHADHRIIIGMRKLGKEDLLVKIAEKFQEWISVPSSMYKTAEILGLPNVFCVDDMNCKIRIIPFHTVTKSNVIGWNDFEPTLAILPTALYTGLGCNPYEDTSIIHTVPYSDHSSYEEICNFVKRIKPKFIHPIVNERPRGGIFGKLADRSDMSCLDKYLSKEPSLKFTIPPTVKKFMSLPMTTYIKKVSRQRRRNDSIVSKKKQNVSLGIVYESPQKTETNMSYQEFECQLDRMKNAFGKIPDSKPHPQDKEYDTVQTKIIKENEKQSKQIVNSINKKFISDEVKDSGNVSNTSDYLDNTHIFVLPVTMPCSKQDENENLTKDSTEKDENMLKSFSKDDGVEILNISKKQNEQENNITGKANDSNVITSSIEHLEVLSNSSTENATSGQLLLTGKTETKNLENCNTPLEKTVKSSIKVPVFRDKQIKLDVFMQSNLSKSTSEKKETQSVLDMNDDQNNKLIKAVQSCMSEIPNKHVDSLSNSDVDRSIKVEIDILPIKQIASCPNQSMDFIYNNTIPASEKVKFIALKPLNMKRGFSVSSDLCVFPVKRNENLKRHSADDYDKNDIMPLKRSRTLS